MKIEIYELWQIGLFFFRMRSKKKKPMDISVDNACNSAFRDEAYDVLPLLMAGPPTPRQMSSYLLRELKRAAGRRI